MITKLLASAALLAALGTAFGNAFAAVDVNSANEDALRGIKGIGPAKAKAILDERGAHGPFKDAADLGKRVKGLGGHTVERLQSEGLAVGPAGAQAGAGAGAKGEAQKAAQAKAAPPGQAATAVMVKK